MKKIAQIVIKYPRYILLGLFIMTIAIGTGLSKLETKNNQDSELPEDAEIVKTNDYIKEIFGKKEVLMIGVEESKTIYNKSTLDKIVKISKELENIEGVIADEITSISTINNIQGRAWGLEVGPLMEEVPDTDEALLKLKQEITSNELVNGRLVSKDGTFTAIIANLEEEYDQTKVHTAVLAILEKYEGNEKYFLAGSPTSQHEIDSGIQKDIGLLFPLALLLLLIGYFISFRTAKGVILPFLVVVLSIVWTMGLMGHIGYPITVVSSVVPMLMIAVSSSYGIHVLHRYYEEVVDTNRKEAARLTIEKIGPAILMTGITSALGSATLIIFKVTSIQEFGIITAIGILSTLVLSILLIPATLALSKKTEEKKNPESRDTFLNKFLLKLAHISIQHKKKVLVFTIALLIIAGFGMTQIRIGADFMKYFPKDHALTSSFEKFNDKLGGVRSLDIMIEAKDIDMVKAPVFLKKIADFQKFAESQQGVGYSSSFSDIIKRIHMEINDGEQLFNTIPDTQNTIAQYLLLYSMSADPGDFGDLVDYDYQRAKVKLFLTTSEQDDHLRLYETFKTYADTNFGDTANVAFGGEVMFWLAQVNYIVTGKIQNIILAIFVVLIFCMIVLRSFVAGILSVVPLTVSSILTFGVMGFLGIRLEAGTAIITAIGIGIGVDFAVHYLLRFQEEIKRTGNLEEATNATILTSGKAIIYDVMSNVLGFMVFVFSGFLPIQYFGWLISITMITVAFGSLVFFPALIAVFKPKFYTRYYKTEKTTEQKLSMVS